MDNNGQNSAAIPTQAWNNPVLAPFLGLSVDEALELGEVREETNTFDPQSGFVFPPQGPNNALAILRNQFPYVQIIPFPPQVRTVALVQNVPQDIEIPDFVQAVLLRGNKDYYVSNHANAEVPVAGNQLASKSIFKPESFMLFTGGIKSLSLISPDVGCVVTLLGYAPTEMPHFG